MFFSIVKVTCYSKKIENMETYKSLKFFFRFEYIATKFSKNTSCITIQKSLLESYVYWNTPAVDYVGTFYNIAQWNVELSLNRQLFNQFLNIDYKWEVGDFLSALSFAYIHWIHVHSNISLRASCAHYYLQV